MTRGISRLARAVVPLFSVGLLSILALAACGSGSGTSTSDKAAAGGFTSAPITAVWQKVIDNAMKEGSVTIYSSQGSDQLKDLAQRFEKNYGIKVNVLRSVDSNIEAKASAERKSRQIADVLALSDQQWVTEKAQSGWYTKPTGPDFGATDYNPSTNLLPAGPFVTGAAVFAIGWNTQLVPNGIKSYKDLLNPKFKGKIGVNDPSISSSVVDFYHYLQEQNGQGFIQDLASQKPQIFRSVLTQAQSLTSGQIAIALAVPALVKEKAEGAPVDYLVPTPAWGARFSTGISSKAPHPNAAQLLSDFLVTQEGQTAIDARGASVLPGIKGTVTSVDKVRNIDYDKLTTSDVKQFDSEFQRLFQ